MISVVLALALAGGPSGGPPLKGDSVSPFEMVRPEGGIYEWKPGRVTVLCAFAYWCDTWKTQRVRLIQSRNKLSGLPVDYLGISVDGHWLDVDKKADWSQRLIDSGSRWSQKHGIDRVPYTLVIDPSGTVTWAGYGISRSEDIVREVRNAMAEPEPTSGAVYLTFDDFPAKANNAELLDTLRRLDVHANFFVIGENASADPKWVDRAVADGHQMDVHAWHHDAKNDDPARCRTWLAKRTGINPTWVRGPGSSVIQDFSGSTFSATEVDPYDFLRPGVGELERRIFGRLKPNSVLHLHAGVVDTIQALPDIVERAQKLGLHFELLPQATN